MIRAIVKRHLLKKRKIYIDKSSDINYGVEITDNDRKTLNVDSHLHIEKMGSGCLFEHVYGYGNIQLGKNVSISGPGTVLHAEIGKIQIGSYTSIAPNVCIMEFNHDMSRPTTYAMAYNVFGEEFKKDVISKGDIIIGEDVWIGANSVITSGVTIGRGAVIAAGSVVTKEVKPYSVVGGCPARLIKMRFQASGIDELEKSEWWNWNERQLLENYDFFTQAKHMGNITKKLD